MNWLVITRRTVEFDPVHLPAHYHFLDALRSKGVLALSGPFDDGSGGAYVVKASSRTDAEAIAASDPLFARGCSNFDLRGWQIRERD